MRHNLWVLLWISFALLFGIFYMQKTAVKIDIPSQTQVNGYSDIHITSAVRQSILLDITAGHNKITKVVCETETFDFGTEALKWYETPTQRIMLQLAAPVTCRVYTAGKHPYTVKAVRVYTYTDMIFFLLTFGTVIAYLLYRMFLFIFDHIRKRFPVSLKKPQAYSISRREKAMLYGIVATGIVLRLFYFDAHGIYLFQHDWQGHIAYIEYMASHWHIPLPSKGLEYPQQPLYYIIAALIYKAVVALGYTASDALMSVGVFSLICSLIFLVYTYKLLDLLHASFFVRSVTLLFVSLTPSIVYLSARINNDVLVMALASLSLYYIVRYYFSTRSADFYPALLFVSALFLTKVSAFPFEVLLLGVIIVNYLKKKREDIVKTHIALYILTGTLLLTWTLYRVYMPLDPSPFHLVNSSAYFPGQQIPAVDGTYFFSFHPGALFSQGYAYVFGADSVRFSFPTYQLGTMMMGEFNYLSYIEKDPFFLYISRLLIIFSTLFPVGLLIYVVYSWKSGILEKLFLLTILLNIALVIHFILKYPVVCNSDFRYMVAVFPLMGLAFAEGLSFLADMSELLRRLLYGWLLLFGINAFVFLLYIIII